MPEVFDSDWDGDDIWDEDDEWPFDCGMGPDGECSMAGSEDCDFECPLMADILAAEARRKKAPHA